MTDLPIALTPPAPVTTTRITAGTPATTRFAPKDTQATDPSAFQEALALLLGIGPDGAPAAVADLPGLALKVGSASESGQELTPTLALTESPQAPAFVGMPTLPVEPLPKLVPPGMGLPAQENGFESMASATPAQNLAQPAKLAWSAETALPKDAIFSNALVDQTRLTSEPTVAPLAVAPSIEIRPFTLAPAAPVQAEVIEARVGENGWDRGLGEKVVWMTSQKLQVAELSLNPPDLGPLKIKISLDENQATIQFVSSHGTVREAIESAMPRLREMLADSGISLGNASVGAETFREQAQQQPNARGLSETALRANSDRLTMGERVLTRALGLVDTFA